MRAHSPSKTGVNARMAHPVLLICLLESAVAFAEPTVSGAKPADNGFVVHNVRSEFQSGPTQIFVRMPAKPASGPLRVLYILPVEAHDGKRWGDARAEVAKLDLANRYGSDLRISDLQPSALVRRPRERPAHPAGELFPRRRRCRLSSAPIPRGAERDARAVARLQQVRLGRVVALLRHPDMFGKAAAWDAPMTMSTPRYGMAPIVGTQQNFERYRITALLRAHGRELGDEPRLMLTGWNLYRAQTQGARRLLQELKIPHAYRDGPQRPHHWNSGWMAELAQWVVR